jgi:SNF2 family DNA or RNA helicase
MEIDNISYFVEETDQLPVGFIELSCLNIVIDHYQLSDPGPIYLDLSRQGNRYYARCGDLVIYQKQGNDFVKIGHFYRNYDYLRGLIMVLRSLERQQFFRLHTKGENLPGQQVRVTIRVFVSGEHLDRCVSDGFLPVVVQRLVSGSRQSTSEALFKISPNANLEPRRLTMDYLRAPYPHQERNIAWMVSLEERVDAGQLGMEGRGFPSENRVCHIESVDRWLYYSSDGGRLLGSAEERPIVFDFRGGVLADGIGLGKSFSFVGLITERNRRRLRIRFSGGKLVLSPKKGVTLILCPARICQQWEQEFALSGSLSVKSVGNFNQFKKLSRDGFESYDVVVMSYQFLVNPSHLRRSASSNIHEFDWERIILDEGHEYLTTHRRAESLRIKESILRLKGRYRWICSGTPYGSVDDFWSLVEFLNGGEAGGDGLHRSHLIEKVKELVFHRSCQPEVPEPPPPTISTIFLEQNSIERAIYQSALGDPIRLVQYCNHIMVSDEYSNVLGSKPLPLSEIHSRATSYLNRRIEALERRRQSASLESEEKEVFLAMLLSKGEPANSLLINDLLDLGQGNREAIEELDRDLSLTKAKYNIFNGLSTSTISNQECPICYDPLEMNGNTAITPCGHIFCRECLESLLKHQSIDRSVLCCPTCRYHFLKGEVRVVKNPKELGEESDDTNQWGSKMAYLLNHLRDVLQRDEHRVIIFSQWDSMLKLVSQSLAKCEIEHVTISGSYNQLKNRINCFKSSLPIRVALLSLEKAVSGLSMIEATHIVLLDTINAEPKRAQLIEEQAIGRSVRLGQTHTVDVRRIIMRNTIEHDNYLKNIRSNSRINAGREIYLSD